MATSPEAYKKEIDSLYGSTAKVTVSKDGSVVEANFSAVTSTTATTLELSDSTAAWKISGTSVGTIEVINTGKGNDTLSLTGAVTGKTFNLGEGSNEVTLATSNGINLTVGNGADVLNFTGTATGNTLNLGGGSDKVTFDKSVINTSIAGSGGDKAIVIRGKLDPSYVSLDGGNHSLTIAEGLEDSEVRFGSGRDTLKVTGGDVKNSTISTGAKADEIDLTGATISDTTIDAGDDNDVITLAATSGAVTGVSINGGAGADEIKITNGDVKYSSIDGGAGKDSIIISKEVLDSSIYGGADNDVIELQAGGKNSEIDLGAGNDSIKISGKFTDTSVSGGDGKDTYFVAAGSEGIELTNFDVNYDVIQVSTKDVSFSDDGTITVKDATGGDSTIKVNATNGYYAAKVSVNGGDATYYGWGAEGSANIDASSWGKPVYLDGRINGDVVDTLIGGSKADTIWAGSGDSVYGGAGRDLIHLDGNTKSVTTDTKEFVGLSTNGGKDTVSGFQANDIANRTTAKRDADEADTVYLFENNITSLVLTDDSNTLVAKVGNGSLTLSSVGTANNAEINVMDNTGTNYKVNYVKDTATTTNDEDEFSDVYYAGSKTAALDFGSYDGNLVVDLSNRGILGSNTGETTYYKEFATVKGGQGETVLMGSTGGKQNLVAGVGDTTLWGGGSKADLLTGYGTASDDVRDVFYYGNGDGKDTVASSAWGSGDDADILWLGQGASVTKVKNDGTNTTITLGNAADKLTLAGKSSTDVAIKFSTDGATTQAAKVGKNGSNDFTYESNVNFYLGGKKNTLTVKDDVDTANIWLDGSVGKAYENVTTVNAAANTGAVTVAGSTAAEHIIAGAGTSSIWGGVGNANDTLTSSAKGTTEFYFGKGEGNDVITASGSDDKVVLYNVGLGDIAGYDDKSSGTLKINMNDGSSLTVQNVSGSSVNTFQLGDGSQWTYTASSKTWSQK